VAACAQLTTSPRPPRVVVAAERDTLRRGRRGARFDPCNGVELGSRAVGGDAIDQRERHIAGVGREHSRRRAVGGLFALEPLALRCQISQRREAPLADDFFRRFYARAEDPADSAIVVDRAIREREVGLFEIPLAIQMEL
jgi:hypothetical protein